MGVPAGLLVHKPGVSSPDQHVEEAEHLEEQHKDQGRRKKRHLKSKNRLKSPSRPSRPSRRPSSHHRDVEGSQAGELGDLAGEVAAHSQRGRDALGARGVLDVLQTLGPGGGAHQPEEDQAGRDQEVLETSRSRAQAPKETPTLRRRPYSQT